MTTAFRSLEKLVSRKEWFEAGCCGKNCDGKCRRSKGDNLGEGRSSCLPAGTSRSGGVQRPVHREDSPKVDHDLALPREIACRFGQRAARDECQPKSHPQDEGGRTNPLEIQCRERPRCGRIALPIDYSALPGATDWV